MQHLNKRALVPPALRARRVTGGRNGAPPGNRNAFKHGRDTRERRALGAEIRTYIRRGRALISLLHPPLVSG